MECTLANEGAPQPCFVWPETLYSRPVTSLPPQILMLSREGAAEKLEGFCQVLEEALSIAHKDLDRLILARKLMSRVTAKTRSNSKLPELVNLFLSRPLVTGPLAAKLLKVTPKAVDLMLAQLGGALPRELTGRTRYRAWGIV
jgi:hypothetical protein